MPVTPLPNRTFSFPRIRLSTSACPVVSYRVTYLHAGGDGTGYRALSSYASGQSCAFPTPVCRRGPSFFGCGAPRNSPRVCHSTRMRWLPDDRSASCERLVARPYWAGHPRPHLLALSASGGLQSVG